MKIVMIFECSDGFTYSCTNVIPLIAESPEQAAVDFEEAYKTSKNNKTDLVVGDTHYLFSDFEEDGEFNLPDFLTIDEWFKRNGLEE